MISFQDLSGVSVQEVQIKKDARHSGEEEKVQSSRLGWCCQTVEAEGSCRIEEGDGEQLFKDNEAKYGFQEELC